MADIKEMECVEIKAPCRPEYVGVIRLAVLGIASRMDFSFDQVEDLRLAVGEACAAAVERAEKNGRQNTDIVVRSCIAQDRLTIDILDNAGRREELPADFNTDSDPRSIADLLITLLVDEVNVFGDDEGTKVSLVKYSGQPHA